MPNVTWSNGNQGVDRYTDFRGFETVSFTDTVVRLQFDDSNGPIDPTRSPFRIALQIEDAEYFEATRGPNAGDPVFTAGTITQINFTSESGDRLIQVSDIDLDLTLFSSLATRDSSSFWDLLTSTDMTYTGSNNGSGPNTNWTGDDIDTGSGNDTVNAGGGNDFISDGGGADIYKGGKGADTVSYQDWYFNPVGFESGIVADLAAGEIIGPDGFVDQVAGIEDVRGTFAADRILGNGSDNGLTGYQGNDFLNGRGGFDVVQYQNDDNQGGFEGIRANLSNGRVRDGFGTIDTLRNIEGVSGTDAGDLFIGSDNGDFWRGRNGNDEFRLGAGDDLVDAAGGADVIIFTSRNFGNDVIRNFEDGEDILHIESASRFRNLEITQDGDRAVVSFANGTIELLNTSASDLSAADFDFG